jgi:hypothetical protein
VDVDVAAQTKKKNKRLKKSVWLPASTVARFLLSQQRFALTVEQGGQRNLKTRNRQLLVEISKCLITKLFF